MPFAYKPMPRHALLTAAAAVAASLIVIASRSGTDERGSRAPAAAPQPVHRSAAQPAHDAVAVPSPPATARIAAAAAAPAPDAPALLAAAAAARARGDLRTTLALLEDAAARAPGVQTDAALGALYLELGAAERGERHLRAAAEGDPGNADRWIALANALAAKPDPMAAAAAIEHARDAEPGLRITRDAGGRLVRDPAAPPPA